MQNAIIYDSNKIVLSTLKLLINLIIIYKIKLIFFKFQILSNKKDIRGLMHSIFFCLKKNDFDENKIKFIVNLDFYFLQKSFLLSTQQLIQLKQISKKIWKKQRYKVLI